MIRQLLIILIMYLLFNQLILYFNNSELDSDNNNDNDSENNDDKDEIKKKKTKKIKSVEKNIPIDMFGTPHDYKPNEYIVWTFSDPVPWTQIIYMYGEEYPFKFFIKIKVPSLNDYQMWKQIVPNIDFNSKTSEIIIPSKNEASALAIANLIVSTFTGQMTIETVLEKNLIQISVTKALQFELVRNKLREQILEGLNNKTYDTRQTETGKNDYEADLARTSSKNEISAANNVETFHESSEPMAAGAGEGYSFI
jgi:hypothetical protein